MHIMKMMLSAFLPTWRIPLGMASFIHAIVTFLLKHIPTLATPMIMMIQSLPQIFALTRGGGGGGGGGGDLVTWWSHK